MRNWNKLYNHKQTRIIGVFTVPMRNWNSTYNTSCNRTGLCFYSTYEELKHVRHPRACLAGRGFLQYLWGIETGVIVPVLRFILMFLQYLWGIETLEGVRRINIPSTFLQYLWGIETRQAPARVLSRAWVFTVPMRNWNCPRRTSLATTSQSFYSTYEELKPEIKRLESIVASKFLQYLWGIETLGLFKSAKIVVICFYSTYEELKLTCFNKKFFV